MNAAANAADKTFVYFFAIIWFVVLALGVFFCIVCLALALRDLWPISALKRNKKHKIHLEQVARTAKTHFYDQDCDSVIGYRYAYLILHNSRPYFGSVSFSGTFPTSANAKCKIKKKHNSMVPKAQCCCGFYSAKDVRKLPKIVGNRIATKYVVVLQVQLSGKYIPGDDGYRAARQDVLSVWLPSSCCECSAQPTYVVDSDKPKSFVRRKAKDRVLVPVCTLHSEGYEVRLTLSDLRNAYRTEMQWFVDEDEQVLNPVT